MLKAEVEQQVRCKDQGRVRVRRADGVRRNPSYWTAEEEEHSATAMIWKVKENEILTIESLHVANSKG